MKKLTLILAILISFNLQAQKIKLKSGDLGFLKGQKNILIEFVYPDNMKVGKMTEEAYIKKKTKDLNKKKPGDGERWLKLWKGDRPDHYQPKFIELMNKGLIKNHVKVSEDTEKAKYKMVVTTTFIEPGFNVGVMRRDASINLEISFYEIGSDKELAKFTLMKSPGRTMGGVDFDTGFRVGESYAKAAKSFAKYLMKKKAL